MKVIVAICSFIVLFFLASFQSAQAATYVDLEPVCLAYSKDLPRPWAMDCKAYTDPGFYNSPPIDSICLPSGVINSEAIGNHSLLAGIGNVTGIIVPEYSTLCNISVDTHRAAEIQKLKQQSAMGTTDMLIASMYQHPPASGVDYIAYVADNAGFAPPAYAQGVGYSGLRPLLPLWTMFRNISYLVVVVIFVVIGFMVMFRMKLDPQTVITVQSAIPNVVVALILITFSYAIAGLLIDLMYLVMNLMITVFVQNGLLDGVSLGAGGINTNDPTEIIAVMNSSNASTLFKALYELETIQALVEATADGGWSWGNTMGLGHVSGLIVGTLGGAMGMIGGLLIAIALLFSFFRIFFILLMSYIQIILLVIMGPFYLLMGAIPGRNSFRNWIFALIGNLSVYPVTIGILLIGLSIAGQAISVDGTDAIWGPPLLFGTTSTASTWIALINFGLIMLTPQLITTVKGLFAPKPIIPISPLQVASPITGAIQTGGQLATQGHYAQMTFGPILNRLKGGKASPQK